MNFYLCISMGKYRLILFIRTHSLTVVSFCVSQTTEMKMKMNSKLNEFYSGQIITGTGNAAFIVEIKYRNCCMQNYATLN